MVAAAAVKMPLSSIFPFGIHVVKGHSMQPSIREGERIVIFRWAYLFSQPKVGDVVVFRSGDGKEYVKRITAVAAKDGFVVEGDNKGDSKRVPPILSWQVIGRVIAKY